MFESQELLSKNDFSLNYSDASVHIVNNGHTIQFNIDNGSEFVFAAKHYKSLQFHMHSLSEHTIDGKQFPLEMHFEHQAEDGSNIVIGVLYKEGKESLFSINF